MPARRRPGDRDYSKLKICGRCSALRGRWTDRHGQIHTQGCECKCAGTRGVARRGRTTWPGFDFNKIAELCYCCGAEVLRSGSRWSVWFCSDCKARVDAVHRRTGGTVIPIGRHSLMAGVGLSGAAAKQPDAIEALLDGLESLSVGIDLLHSWASKVVAENLRACGFRKGQEVSVLEYVDAIDELPVDKAQTFKRMQGYLQKHRARRI